MMLDVNISILVSGVVSEISHINDVFLLLLFKKSIYNKSILSAEMCFKILLISKLYCVQVNSVKV